MSQLGQTRRYVSRGTSDVRSTSDIGARLYTTTAAVSAAMIEAATTNCGTKRNSSAG
jgi:hypothetical protein